MKTITIEIDKETQKLLKDISDVNGEDVSANIKGLYSSLEKAVKEVTYYRKQSEKVTESTFKLMGLTGQLSGELHTRGYDINNSKPLNEIMDILESLIK